MKTKILLLALGLLLPTTALWPLGHDLSYWETQNIWDVIIVDGFVLSAEKIDGPDGYEEEGYVPGYVLHDYIGEESDVVIPDSVAMLGSGAFWRCNQVKTVTLPKECWSMEMMNAFQFCDNLEAVYVEEGNPSYFSEDGVLIGKNRYKEPDNIGFYPPAKKDEVYMVPDYITDMCNIYMINRYLKKIIFRGDIPNGEQWYKLLGEWFPNLEIIDGRAGDSNYAIIDGVLYNRDVSEFLFCPPGRTKPLVIPKTVTKLDVSKLFGCTRLSGISVEEGGHFIVKNDILYSGDETRLLFCARGKNGSVTDLPATLRSVDARAFANCTLLRDIALPTVEEIGPDAFSGCVRLAMVDMPKAGIIGERAFENCTALSIVTLPPTGRSIGAAAFKNSGVSSIIVPDGVSVIEESVFDGCSNLIQVVFPASLDTIKDYAFQNTSLVRFTIPGSVKDIRQLAFGYCPNLREVTVEWPVPLKSVSGNAFLGVANSRVRLRVPLGSKSGYEAMFPWRTFVIDEYELPSFIPDGILDAEDISIYSASGAKGLVIRLREGIDLQRVQLFDFSGRQVYSGTSAEIDRSELGMVGPGSFILRIETTHGLYVGKVVL